MAWLLFEANKLYAMKKTILTGLLLAGPLFAVKAQNIIYSQDFEGPATEIWDEGWEVIGFEGNTENTGIYGSTPRIEQLGFTGETAGSASFVIGKNGLPQHIEGVDNAIRTPVITLPEGGAHLRYRIGFLNVGATTSANYSVYAVTAEELETLDAGAIQELLDANTAIDARTIGVGSSLVEINLGGLETENVVVFFRLHNTPGNGILLFDDVQIISGTLGTNDTVLPSFTAYPNPVTDVMSIEAQAIQEITISDMNGRVILCKAYDNVDNTSIDLSGLQGGVFLVKVVSGQGHITREIIKL